MRSWGFSRKVLGLFSINSIVLLIGISFIFYLVGIDREDSRIERALNQQNGMIQDIVNSARTFVLNFSRADLIIVKDRKNDFSKSLGLLLGEGEDQSQIVENPSVKEDLEALAIKWQTLKPEIERLTKATSLGVAEQNLFRSINKSSIEMKNIIDQALVHIRKDGDHVRLLIRDIVVALIVVVLLTYFAQLFYVGHLKRELVQVLKSFSKVDRVIEESNTTVTVAAQELGETASEQASAIHETSSAVTEVSKMIHMTLENLQTGTDLAQSAEGHTSEGESQMESMTASIEELKSNSDQLNDLNQIIQSVSEKTEVINEIVSKTQLLSFNASIEAARAGQYGKGFSVVAAEVGKLAQLSGNSSNAIDGILIHSQRQVEDIVSALAEQVEQGVESTHKGVGRFRSVARQIRELSQLMQQISVATVEQQQGVDQCLEALKNLQTTAEGVRSRSIKLNNALQNSARSREHFQKSFQILENMTNGISVKSKASARKKAISIQSKSKSKPSLKSEKKHRKIS